MQQTDLLNRQRSLSNNSSINTPKLKKRLSDFKKNSIVFSQILIKQKPITINSQHNSIVLNQKQIVNSKQSNLSIPSKLKHNYTEKPHIKKTTQYIIQDNKPKITPCQDLFNMFINHKLSQQYIQQIQNHKFKHLVIISIILPTQMMKKLTKFIDFSQQYKISLPQTVFSTDFIKLIHPNQNQDINYVFWTYQIPQVNQNLLRNSLNLAYSGKNSPKSSKSIRDLRNRKLTNFEVYNGNLRELLIQIPQIVITQKGFIKQNSQLFFPQLLTEVANISSSHGQYITLQPQLDIEKTLLYFDQQQVSKQSIKSIQTPRYLQASQKIIKQMKTKNPQLKSNSYIEIQPQQQFYDVDQKYKQKTPILSKGQIDKLNTVRSNYQQQQQFQQQKQTNKNQNIQLYELLQKQSIFKHINYLQPFWLENNQSLYVKGKSTPKSNQQTKKIRKNSFNNKNIEIQKLQKFKLLLQQQIKLSIKKNYHYSKFCSTYLFLHFITNFYQHNISSKGHTNKIQQYQDQYYNDQISTNSSSYTNILNKSLKSFKKQIQLRFFQRIQNQYKQVIDQATLRNTLRNIKMEQIIFMKKNISSIIFPINSITSTTYQSSKNILLNHHQTQLNKQYIIQMQSQINNFMDRLQEQIYFENNKQAMIMNQKILQTQYQKIIQTGFRRQRLKKKQSLQSNSSLNSDQRPLSLGDTTSRKRISTQSIATQLQRDFNDFMQSFLLKGIKVSSQMKSFSDFMEKIKQSYIKNINQLTRQKKSNQRQQQQRQNKNRMIKLLQMQIFKLDDKKKQIKDKNDIIKKQIKNSEDKYILQVSKQNKNQSSSMKQKNNKSKSKDNKSSLFINDRDKYNSNKKNLQSNQKDKKLTGLSFQIQSKSKSIVGISTQNNYKKFNYNRFEKSQNKYNKKQSDPNKICYYNRQLINQNNQSKTYKNKCLQTCCSIM